MSKPSAWPPSPLPPPVVAAWNFAPAEDGRSPVLPDGCRDLIVRLAPDGRPHWFVSELADTVAEVPCQAGEIFVGYRLHPAAALREAALLEAVRKRADLDPATVLALIDDHVRLDRRLAEALAGLAAADGVAAAGRLLGVSERSLERLAKENTGRSPAYWKNLARARRAAAALAGLESLAEIAAGEGYADQAHLCREFKKWFGISPSRFRDRPALLAQAAAAGYR